MSKSKMSTTRPRGRLIVFEGLDGSGKSTQIRKLHDALVRGGRPVTVVTWCSDGVVGRHIQSLLEDGTTISRQAFCALHAADYADQLSAVILPALKRGDTVLCDRSPYTEIARAEASGLDSAWVERLFDWAPEPDLVLYFDLPVDMALERVNRRMLKEPTKKVRRTRRIGVAGTMGLGLETAYQPDGEPMTELIRRRQLREFQQRVASSYARLATASSFTMIDAAQPESSVRRIVADATRRAMP